MNDINNLIIQAKYEAKNNWIKGTHILLEGINEHPNESRLHDSLGDLYFKHKHFSKAIQVYHSALRLSPKNSDIIFKLAVCYMVEKEYEKAIVYFEQVSDDIPEAVYNKCVALYYLNRSDQAIKDLEELTTKTRDSLSPYLLLAKIYIELQRNHKAISILKIAEKAVRPSGEVYYLRACAYFNQKNWLKSYVDFSKAEKLFEFNPRFYQLYSTAAELIGQTDKAISLLENCIQDFPKFFPAYYDLIDLYKANDMYEKLMEVLNILSEHGLSIEDRYKFSNHVVRKKYNEKSKHRPI